MTFPSIRRFPPETPVTISAIDSQPQCVASIQSLTQAKREQEEPYPTHTVSRQKPCALTVPGWFMFLMIVLLTLGIALPTAAQDTVTGAFEGTISDSQTGTALKSALVEIINQQTGITISLRSDFRGRFYQGLLLPGIYRIRVSTPGYQPREVVQRLKITYPGEVVPIPVALDPAPTVVTPAPTPTPNVTVRDTEIRAGVNRLDGRRGGSFTEEEVSTLPLGSVTVARSFDELALLLPGVAPPPQTLGNVAGPGVGAGVGSAGQFAVNGLRSRGNNFTVDGSDNNDEDIGVRRQGFVALIAQSLESIKEYQVQTLLAPAQFGRNLGAQVNAVSRSGGSSTHGSVYGSFNSSQLNARSFFDTTDGNQSFPLRSASGQSVLLNGSPLSVSNASGGEDSFTQSRGGFVLGGPAGLKKVFYFVSLEAQKINATSEEQFAVPTIEQRGGFSSGASGIFRDPFTGAPAFSIPNNRDGSAIFNLYPFPNHPNGLYGANTFTQTLPANARSVVASGKLDANFTIHGRQQSITERYNITDDYREIPVTGGAIFSTLRPRVRTQNSSFFFNSEISAPGADDRVFNQVRFSYGRTRLKFEEVRDRQHLIPSNSFPNTPFLLNAPLRFNVTQPASPGLSNQGPVLLSSPISIGNIPSSSTVEQELGAIGQVSIAGFSPLGVDVFNFPQKRINNTYQIADELTWRRDNHVFAFGGDIRHSQLDSDLPRNSRPLVTFNSSPRLILENGVLRLPTLADPNPVVRAEDLAAFGAANNFFLTLDNGSSGNDIKLRFYQFNFYGQDSWRVRPNLSLSFGLRFEYNTPVWETSRRIENTFDDPALALAPGIRTFIAGRNRIYDPDKNNWGPRFGLAYSLQAFGPDRLTVIRAGYGLFYDQILGAVASQSRNVYPTFLTLNFGGLAAIGGPATLTLTNPARTFISLPPATIVPIQQPGTLNRYNPQVPLDVLLRVLNIVFPSALGATIPARNLEMPSAQHYSVAVEQMVNSSLTVSLAYVGTQGRHLLRFTTPNLGPSSTIAPVSFSSFQLNTLQGLFQVPEVLGMVRSPNRSVAGIGAIHQFETSANSNYNSLQVEARGIFRRSLNYRAAYTLASAVDDVSDVFDLAGAFALPQNSISFAGERGPANFDVRHRFSYNLIYDLPKTGSQSFVLRMLTRGVQLASSGTLRSGQPFTVNSTIDVNLDGNTTDRLNNTNGLVETGDRQQPLRLTTTNPVTLLAPFGQDGSIGRNTFRAGNVLDLNLAIIKTVSLQQNSLSLTVELFNFINRANFGVPVRILEAPGFGRATNTVTPARRVQFSARYSF